MYVTGPGGPYLNLNIQAVGTPQRKGSDSFFATTGIISGGSNGDTYRCVAVNGVSTPPTNSVQLRGNLAILNFPCNFLCMQAKCITIITAYLLSSCQCCLHNTRTNTTYYCQSGVESAIRRSHSDWLCGTLQ